jgi:hypothetical protein
VALLLAFGTPTVTGGTTTLSGGKAPSAGARAFDPPGLSVVYGLAPPVVVGVGATPSASATHSTPGR